MMPRYRADGTPSRLRAAQALTCVVVYLSGYVYPTNMPSTLRANLARDRVDVASTRVAHGDHDLLVGRLFHGAAFAPPERLVGVAAHLVDAALHGTSLMKTPSTRPRQIEAHFPRRVGTGHSWPGLGSMPAIAGSRGGNPRMLNANRWSWATAGQRRS